jgi:sporulation protein YlmC with PRC-barrel domain
MNMIREERNVLHVLVKSAEVIGVSVKNSKNENLGKIEEIVLDKKTGQTSYVVLSFGGILGLGNKLFALPWHAISYDVDNDCFILNESKERLENAPGFDKSNWPNMADKAWNDSIYNYYGKRT